MRSYSSFVSSPESTNVFANSFASFVETREAFATIDAKNDDATDASIDDDDRISFRSYLNGAILFVLSIDWRLDDSLRFTLFFFWAEDDPGMFGEEFLYVTAKLITPVGSKRNKILKLLVKKVIKMKISIK